MIDPKNQIIYKKGMVVNFDDLPLIEQSKLLYLWKLKPKQNAENSGTKSAEPTSSGTKSAGTKQSKKDS